MSTATEFNTQSAIEGVVPNVFGTMLGLSPTPITGGGPLMEPNRVGGTIGIAGDNVTGAIYVHLPEALARVAVNAMFGNPAEQPVEEGDINDVIGELTNMIGGGFKSALCDAGRACAMSTPSVIRGAYVIEAPPDLRAEIIHFRCQGQPLAVEIHIKFD